MKLLVFKKGKKTMRSCADFRVLSERALKEAQGDLLASGRV